MIKKLLSFVALSIITFTVSAQIPVYKNAYRIAGTGSDNIDFICSDGSGNVFVSGRFGSGCDFDPSAGTNTINPLGGSDIFVAFYNNAGALVWVNTITSSSSERVNGMKLDQFGNLFVFGDFFGNLTINGQVSSTTLTNNGGTDAFVAKYNGQGNIQFAFNIGNTNTEYFEGIDFAPNGDFYLGGEFSSPTLDVDPGSGSTLLNNPGSANFSFDAFLAKYDSLGNFIWAFSMQGSSSDYVKAVSVDQNGDVFVGGYFNNSLTLDSAGTGILFSNTQDCFIAKYSPNGIYSNAWSFGGSGFDFLYGIKAANNKIYATGTFTQSIDLAPGVNDTLLATAVGSNDVFFACYTNSGTADWGGRMGGPGSEGVHTIDCSPAGDVFIVGNFQDSADFDSSPGLDYINGYGGRDGFVVKYDAAGNYKWTLPLGSGGTDFSRGIAFAPGNEFWTGGYYSIGSLIVNPLNTNINLPNIGSNDAFFARYGECTYPIVNTQPVTAGICSLDNANFSITASGSNVTYQWQEGTNGGVNWINITNGGNYIGTNTPNLGIIAVNTNYNNRLYRCIISADCGLSTTSGVGILFVSAPDTSVIASGIGTLVGANVIGATYQWFNCNNFSPVIGATNRIFSPTTPGNYALQITVNGCADTSACYNVSTVGLNELNLSSIELYPVPAKNTITVISSIEKPLNFSVLDLTGRMIMKSSTPFVNKTDIDLSALHCGAYFIQLSDENGNSGFKQFIKQ